MLLVGCASYPKKNGFQAVQALQQESLNPYFSNAAHDYVYKAKIRAFDKSFGGILVIKKMGQDHHRIAFTTEMGNTIFDFSFDGETFKVNRILAEMDKKILVNVLKKDFTALIKEAPEVEKAFAKGHESLMQASILSNKHYYSFFEGQLRKIIRMGSGKEKVGFLFSGINDNIAENIEISHKNIKLEITLKAI